MHIFDLFSDHALVEKIQRRLPEAFYLAEQDSSRAGRVGMEVGSAREKILIALLLHKFGEANVETNLSIHEPEADVKVFGEPLSIKTFTGSTFKDVKIIWTVDHEQVIDFSKKYLPSCDMLLAQVNWGGVGGLFYFTKAAQIELLNRIGRERYIKIPKTGTNPRGVSISSRALGFLARNPSTHHLPIRWVKTEINYNIYKRWINFWQED